MNALTITGANPGNIRDICYDSRQVKKGSVFVAIRGNDMDGHDFIGSAVKKGARAIVAEKVPHRRLPGNVTLVIVGDSRSAMAKMADYYYDSPSESMGVIGITGTNGKTTISYLLESIFTASGKRCGRIGTVEYSLLGQAEPAPNTTPESLDLQRMMKELVDRRADYLALEVSSHALVQRRVEMVTFRSAIFTNLTRDHLDYHRDMDDYFLTKKRLFTEYSPDISIINADDPFASRLMAQISGEVLTYGSAPSADARAENISISPGGIEMDLSLPCGRVRARSGLIGDYNISNILACALTATAEGLGPDVIAEGIENLKAVPGRMEKVDEGQPFDIFVDYAHTGDALARALETVKKFTNGRLITVFGCGGDRDHGKRPIMGRAGWQASDKLVITSDNPRSENPEKIIEDILEGVDKSENPDGELVIEPDRHSAITKAITLAQPGDMVLIAGKGHEDYQIVGSKRLQFDDRAVARSAVRKRYGEIQGT